jgi:RNA polymerase sigma factor (sigma-70 family)
MDSRLVASVRDGDREAYEELARSTSRRLYPVAIRMLRAQDLADDAVQRTLVAIWRELPKLRDVDKFEAWSYRLLVRFCLRELSSRRYRLQRIDELSLSSPEDPLNALALRDQLERAFRLLSAEHRAVLVLVYYAGLRERECATALGVAPGTVASRLHYAKRCLRAALEADGRAYLSTSPAANLERFGHSIAP